MSTQIINNGTQILGNDGNIPDGTQVISGGTQILNVANQAEGTQIIGDSTTDLGAVFAGGLLTKGTEISGWKIVDKISVQSGEADLYIAEKNEEKGVIKYYRGHIHPKTDLLEKLTNLHHPDIINVYEFGEYQGHFYEIMEYAAGGALDTRNEDGSYKYLPLSEEKVIQVCKEIINSYKTCHERGIIHRDIKPANIYYKNADGSDIVIGDFGISSLYEENEIVSHKTQTASRTTGYAAPEVLSGIISPKMDYYALGITLWELSTGKDPFVLENGKRRNDAHLLRDTIEGRIADDLLSREPKLSDSMQHLIRGLLVIDENQRWGYEEVVRHLNGELVEIAQKNVKEWEYKIESESCTTLEQVGNAILKNIDSESLKKEIFRGFLAAFFEDKYPDIAKKIEEIVESTSSDMNLCLKKIALLLNPTIPYISKNGYKIENLDDIVDLIKNAPEEMVDILDSNDEWFYIYIEHIGYNDKIQEFQKTAELIRNKSGFYKMLSLGKLAVSLTEKTAIKPFSLEKYKDITLTDFEQLSTLPDELRGYIISVIKNKSLEGLILPWLLTIRPQINLAKINNWNDLINPISENGLYVSKGDLTEFCSIQAAIDKAEDGFIIYIDKGIYEEKLDISKKLTFIGIDKEKVIVQQPKGCVCEVSDASSFKNITFKNIVKNDKDLRKDEPDCPRDNALVKCCSTAFFENCYFIDSFSNGIIFTNSTKSSIENCKISNIAYGGIYTQESNLFVTDSEISFTGDAGLYLDKKSDATIKNCKIHDILRSGVVTKKSSKLTAESCEVYQIENDLGVFVEGKGSEISLTNCKVHDIPGNFGLYVGSESKLTAESCEVYQTKIAGVGGEVESEITLTNCKVHDIPEGQGLLAGVKTKLTAESCEVYQIENGIGVFVDGGGAEISLTNCKIHDISDSQGLRAEGLSKLTAESCEVYQTKRSGVCAWGEGSEIRLTNCKVHDIPDNYGLCAENKGKLTAESCEVYQTKYAGVYAHNEGSEISLTNCKIHDISDSQGLRAEGFSKLTAESCEVYQTKYAGVYAHNEGAVVRLTNCKIHDISDSQGLCAEGYSKLTAESCEVYQTKRSGVCAWGEGSAVRLMNCKIHSISLAQGILVANKGELTAESCEFYETGFGAVKLEGEQIQIVLKDCFLHHASNGVGIDASSTNRKSVPDISSVKFGDGINRKLIKPSIFSF